MTNQPTDRIICGKLQFCLHINFNRNILILNWLLSCLFKISERSPVPEKDQVGIAFSDSDWFNIVQVKCCWFSSQLFGMNDNAYKTYYFDHKPKSHLLEEIGRGQTRGRGAVVWLYRLHAVLQNAWVCFGCQIMRSSGHFMHSNKSAYSATFTQNCKEGM